MLRNRKFYVENGDGENGSSSYFSKLSGILDYYMSL